MQSLIKDLLSCLCVECGPSGSSRISSLLVSRTEAGFLTTHITARQMALKRINKVGAAPRDPGPGRRGPSASPPSSQPSRGAPPRSCPRGVAPEPRRRREAPAEPGIPGTWVARPEAAAGCAARADPVERAVIVMPDHRRPVEHVRSSLRQPLAPLFRVPRPRRSRGRGGDSWCERRGGRLTCRPRAARRASPASSRAELPEVT